MRIIVQTCLHAPASFYVADVLELLFGSRKRRPDLAMKVNPPAPRTWEAVGSRSGKPAALHTPDASISGIRNKSVFRTGPGARNRI
jgi:hypothetical protein